MKTHEGIKNALKIYASGEAWDVSKEVMKVCRRALTYIKKLESRLAQVERERDAMSYDMHQLQGALCAYCENLYRPDGSEKVSCKIFGDGYGEKDGSPLICGRFKWRGVCEENTKEVCV